jgi:hypothetical protein
MMTLWSRFLSNVLLTDSSVQIGKIIFEKPHSRIRFDPLNFSKDSHSRDMFTWKPNSRTQWGRLAHILIDQMINHNQDAGSEKQEEPRRRQITHAPRTPNVSKARLCPHRSKVRMNDGSNRWVSGQTDTLTPRKKQLWYWRTGYGCHQGHVH